MKAPFVSDTTFLDQNYRLTAEERAKQYSDYVRMRYAIGKKTNTSYRDTGYLTPVERTNLMKFITEDEQKRNEMFEKLEESRNNN